MDDHDVGSPINLAFRKLKIVAVEVVINESGHHDPGLSTPSRKSSLSLAQSKRPLDPLTPFRVQLLMCYESRTTGIPLIVGPISH